MLAQANQSVASAFRRSSSAARTGTQTCQFFSTLIIISLLLVIFMARTVNFPNSSQIPTNCPTNVPRTDSPDLGHGSPNSPVPSFNSSEILDLAEFDEEGESLRKEANLILEGDFDKFLRSTVYLRWIQDFILFDGEPDVHSLYRQAHPHLLDWSIGRLIYNRRRPTEEILLELLGFIGRQEKYSSCAVVGNSHVFFEGNYSADIDSHEAVIRLNDDGIDFSFWYSLRDFVGAKTNISFMNSYRLHLNALYGPNPYCNPYADDVAFVISVCRPIHFLDIALCNNTGKILITDSGFDRLCRNIMKHYSLKRWFAGGENRSLEEWSAAHAGKPFYELSGIQALVMAVGVCERVSIFGIRQIQNPYSSQMELSDYEAEFEFYRDLKEAPERIPFLSSAIGKFEFPPVVTYF